MCHTSTVAWFPVETLTRYDEAAASASSCIVCWTSSAEQHCEQIGWLRQVQTAHDPGRWQS
jgi:hypothetical protein